MWEELPAQNMEYINALKIIFMETLHLLIGTSPEKEVNYGTATRIRIWKLKVQEKGRY